MDLKSIGKNILKNITKAGYVNGSAFPAGTYINFANKDGDRAMIFTTPDSEEEYITHDMIQCASVMAMGVIEIEQKGNQTVLIHGTKYLVVLKDGRQAVLTVGLGESLYKIERILF